jgi:hypothetical protein
MSKYLIALLLFLPTQVLAGFERVEIIHVETLATRACPSQKNADIPAWLEEPRLSPVEGLLALIGYGVGYATTRNVYQALSNGGFYYEAASSRVQNAEPIKCDTGSRYLILYRRSNGAVGETIIRNYPWDRHTMINFCYEGQGKPERPCKKTE